MIKEILAPVGSMEAFYAAIQAGADAVYLAGKSFGARAYADNFTNEDLIDLITYAHIRNVKVYVTVNTLIFDYELDDVLDYVRFLYLHDVDAIIVQDIGVLDMIHRHFPDLDIHASTQMNVHTVKEAIMLKKLGVKRIVVARETDLDQIEAIYQATKLEIEAFIHGALCQSYSGNCLLSSFIGKRSGNRGKCAQPCRLPYQLLSNAKDFPDEYYLSMKDLMTIESLEPILKSNIVSLKIEGRMKRPEYVSVVVQTYKLAIDNYKKTNKLEISPQDIKNLKKVFNREFTKGYVLKENFGSVVNTKRPNHMGILVGTVLDYQNGFAKIELIDDLNMNDGIRFVGNQDFGMTVQQLLINKEKVRYAKSKDIVWIAVTEPVYKDMQVYKTSDYEQLKALKVDINKEVKKVSIFGKLSVKIGEKASLTLWDDRGNHVKIFSTESVVKSNQGTTNKDRLIEQIKKLGNTPFIFESLSIEIDDESYISIKELNELRRLATNQLIESRKICYPNRKEQQYINHEKSKEVIESTFGLRVGCHTLDQLDAAIECGIEEIYYDDLDTIHLAIQKKANVIPLLPRIDFNEDINITSSQVVASELGYLHQYQNKFVITDLYMNVINHKSVHLLHQLNASRITLSPEISFQQMKELVEVYQLNYHAKPNLEVMVYGFYEVMIMKHCLISATLGFNRYDCKACYINQYQLKDRLGYTFPLIRGHQCALKMLNSKRLSLLDQLSSIQALGIQSLRIQLTLESKEESIIIINAFINKLNGIPTKLPYTDLTYGHFKEKIE